jgi:hypothetical protein
VSRNDLQESGVNIFIFSLSVDGFCQNTSALPSRGNQLNGNNSIHPIALGIFLRAIVDLFKTRSQPDSSRLRSLTHWSMEEGLGIIIGGVNLPQVLWLVRWFTHC